ncbi:glycosyl transferase [Neisseria sicca]|jgi:glycosyltransferase|uniref:Glycosyl transferase n=2 Tax=Neisseria TaxID=482 RepID=A0A1V0HD59_NEISI|nr:MULTISPECIES: glycosyltransferase [Neisseria]ARC50779.1 glycosyl transferase [Neisseria mucosa]AVR78000.1 glycosyl transferase [Neisseria mucosa]PLA40278.1 glycosyl transferase [Neisseria sicca]
MNRQAQSPTVSVMIPYYNCKEYIVETIQSVLSQSHQNFEIIIVDDGSDPEHADYLKGFLADKPAIRYAVQNNQGVAAARNHAARLAGGKYFLFLDSDDLILPDYIEKCVTVLENNPDCKLVYPLAEYFDAQEGLWNLPDYDGLESLLKGNRIPIISMHRAEDFVSLGGFDENLTTHEDWDLWIRLLSNGGTVIRIPEVLFRYRKRRDGSSLINRLEQNPDLNREDWQKVYEKNRVLFMQYHLGYSDCIQKISLLEQQIQSLSELNLQLREDNTNMQNQNQELQHVMAKLLQQTELSVEQTEFLQQQIEMLLRNSTVEEQLEEQEKQIKLLKKQIDTLQQEKQSLEQSIHKENRRLAKYKGLWTVKVFKPFVKTEQAISSANRYRKGFRFLVREKGSIGKAYQFLRRHYKQTHSIKSVKQILKAVSSASAFEHSIQADSIPQTFIHRLTKHAADTLAPKVAIIAELSIPQCKKYRVIQKQEMLEELGIPCSVTSWTDSNEAKKQISLASLVIFYRVPGFDSVMDLIAECRRLNIKTLWDVDDLIFDEDVLKTSSTINSLEPAEKEGVINGAKLYRQAMLACNEGIASTSGLAKAMKEAGLETIYVVENALDDETLAAARSIEGRLKKQEDGLIRIIYGSGTKTHNIDFLEAAPALANILKENPNVRFRIIGYLELPEYFDEVQSQIERIPFCNYTEYLTYLSECDISIAPLENFVFNDAKSNIKYLEASITKVASICSPRAAFADVIVNGENGFLADNEQQWHEAFDTLIQNSELRDSMAQAAYRTVTETYSPQAIGSTQLASAVRFESAAKGKTKVLSFNVYYHPQSFGGATIVAEQLNKLLADEEAYEIYAVTTLPMKSWLPPYSVIRYEYGKVTVFGVAVPSEDAAAHENPRFDAAVKDIIELVQPDIAHIHCIQSMGVGMVDICREAGVKTLVTLHDAWWICPNQFMLDENEVFREQWNTEDERSKTIARALAKIDMLLAPSKYFAELHEKTLGRNVLVNKNGVTRPLGQISKRKKDVIRFGYVGGKTKIKGVHLILEAFRKYRFPNTELVVVDNMLNVGARSFFDSDFDGVERFRIEPAYSQDTIDYFFSEIDVLLFPTQWKESFGLTVREAVLRDVWVIATDAGGVSEDIIDGENGTVIPFDSGVEELSRAIAEVCERYQAMDDGAVIELPKSHIRTFAEQKDELAGLYQEILSNQAD